MDEIAVSLEWLQFAEMDLSSAEYLLAHRPLPKEIICFHCQQAAEKMLKGILAIHKIKPPKIHDLKRLCVMCEEYVQEIINIKSACNILNQYSVQPRYPKEIEITEDDVKDAVKQAKMVLDFLKPFFA